MKIKNKVQNLIYSANQKANALVMRVKAQTISAKEVLTDNRGESNSVGTAIGIVMSVVIGLFLITQILSLFGVDIMPVIKTKVGEMFGKG